MTDTTTKAAISANLHALGEILDDAQLRVSEAIMAIDGDGNQNGAIGAVLDLDQQMESAHALLRAALSLHRNKR